MTDIELIKKDVLKGKQIDKDTAMELYAQPLEILCRCADEIRRFFLSNKFDLCAIINGKSGRCSENCRFCAQSACNHTGAEEYPLLSEEKIVSQARKSEGQGVPRFSIVTSGKRLSEWELDKMCGAIRCIKTETTLSVCVSFGLLNHEQYKRLKEAGITRVHNNLEASRRYFPNICTTHTFDDKIEAIRAAQRAGLEVCSGGIMGMGEKAEDRVDMALTLRELNIKSVPVNMLNPIPGTPLENCARLSEADMRRIVAVYRFILPDAFIRLAGGRGLLPDKGQGCFYSGANAAITGDMLTTSGITPQTDGMMLQDLGYEVNCAGRQKNTAIIKKRRDIR